MGLKLDQIVPKRMSYPVVAANRTFAINSRKSMRHGPQAMDAQSIKEFSKNLVDGSPGENTAHCKLRFL